MAHRRQRSWIVPAIFAIVLFAGGVASNLVATDLQALIEPYRWLIWGVFWVALIVAVGVAIRDARRASDDAAPTTLQSNQAYEERRDKYLQRVVDRCRDLPLRSLDPKSASADTAAKDRLGLADVYIALDTTERAPRDGRPTPRSDEQLQLFGDRDQPLSALAAVERETRVVLLGAPGSGKSTFVNHLALCLASDILTPREDWISRLPDWPTRWQRILPIPIVLRDLAAWYLTTQPAQRKTGLFTAYLDFWLNEIGLADFHSTLCEHLQTGRAILLLDGLDEVALVDDVLLRVKEMIDDLPAAYPDTPIVVTCRVLSYQDKRWRLDAQTWPSFELAELRADQVDGFIRAWYNQLAAMHVVQHATKLSEKLSQAVRRPDLWRLARNPLLLTAMALVHTNQGVLPDARSLLYERVVELLLWRWEAIKLEQPDGRETTWWRLLREAELNTIDVQKELWALAYQTHGQMHVASSNEATADIAEHELIDALRKLHPEQSRDWAADLVRIMKERAGLLVESRPQVYTFPHRTFQEYLAACHLCYVPNFTVSAVTLAHQGIYWWEVILLAVGRLTHLGDLEKPLLLIHELCPDEVVPTDEAKHWRQVWLAGRCLIEVGPQRATRHALGRELMERVTTCLVTLITQDKLEPRERAEAGSVLSALGDPRDLAAMVPVKGGPFIMGSTPEQIEAAIAQMKIDYTSTDETMFRGWVEREKPQHQVHVSDFRIARYPVTNGQYADFVAATGHTPPEHWHGQTPSPDLRTHPVVNVSWHDAVAYCAWLSQQRGEEVRLPTEAEWEKAARGQTGLIFPWGDDFDPSLCNMFRTGIGDTSPVGIFSAGASPYGCLDMAGNVWEWTSTLDREYPYRSDDGLEDKKSDNIRVLRGGAFDLIQDFVCCASRLRLTPDLRYLYLGFRVASPGL